MESKAKNGKVKKVLSIVGNTLIWVFVAFSLAITLMVFSAQNSGDGIPSLFGKSLVHIATDSMEDTYMVGDLVLMEKVTLEEAQNLEKGQIITFRAPIDIDGDGNVGDINTHRIYGFIEETGEIITKGDNKPLPDNQSADPYTILPADVIGVCHEEPIKGLGNVITFLRSSTGFLICIVIPLILFFLYELYNFITILVTERQKKAAANAPIVDEEEIKRRAIEEYLAKQRDEEEIKKRAIEEYLAKEAAKNAAENSDSENSESK